MNNKIVVCLFFFLSTTSAFFAQTKVGGVVLDKDKNPIPYANVAFKNSSEGIVTNEVGKFYLESAKTHTILVASSVGYSEREITLEKAATYDLKIKLNDSETLKTVVVFSGKTSKKNNPALDILRKIWAKNRVNGLGLYNQYQMEKYEKVEFDMNTIDSTLMKKQLFKGMEFIFKNVDTSKVTGKTYLPIFINESLYDVYGDNKLKKVKENIKASKASGIGSNQQILSFVKDLYTDYNIYNNHLNLFDKTFTSPLSKTGIDTYSYVLRDSTYIDKKWCYNIIFYPRRKSELTFKGDFWVNDTTFAIKKINMTSTKNANVNWVKNIYLEQEFDAVNDSVFLLNRDYIMTDFSMSKKEDSHGVYGKRTTLFRNHQFDKEKPKAFYKEEINFIDNSVYDKTEEYWEENRFENLNKDEKGIYKMLDTLQTVKKYKHLFNVITLLDSGFYHRGGIDYGPIFTVIGNNQVEGLRLRVGARTYFGPNDPWRIQAYTAYGFKDNKFKYGIAWKWMIDKKNRFIISVGNRRDVEQIGASLTLSNDVLGRSYASSGVFTFGSNNKLTSINLSNIEFEIEPFKNLILKTGYSYRTLESASESFSLDYYTDVGNKTKVGKINQSEINLQLEYTPGIKNIGYGVERDYDNSPFSRFFVSYSQGFKGSFRSDFNYSKLQLYYKKPIIIGPLGRTNLTLEMGKTFGAVPLGLMSVIPGNQSAFNIVNSFSNLRFYEFVADQYVTLKWDHNFNGRLFSRIPFMRKLDWREIVGVKSVYGTVSESNKQINASGLTYNAPEKVYWEYSVGISNIYKVFRLDFNWRGSYLNTPESPNFGVKASFGFYF
jgi:Family of unknown function (DUF5686)/CarboxypepD_reg-like domain